MHTTVTPFAARRENGAATEADAVALADPEVAVIVARPFATARTSPLDHTVATAAADVAHVLAAYDVVLALVAEELETGKLEERLGMPVNEPIFSVR